MSIVVFAIGLLLGILISTGVFLSWHVGSLRIDESDSDDGAYFFLELSARKSNVFFKRNFVVLKVVRENFIPHD